MKKFIISLFILVDLVAMGGSAVFLVQYIQIHRRSGSKAIVDVRSLPVITMMPVIPSRTTPTSVPPPVQAQASTSAMSSIPMEVASGKTMSPGSATPATKPMDPSPVALPPGPGANNHNVLFSYFNSKAKEVFIRADFTGWRAEPMKKGSGNKWMYTAVLTPGEYAYCFSVDGRSIKDPANKRTKRVGQTLVSAKTVGTSQAVVPVTPDP